jgi:hypothetical protein
VVTEAFKLSTNGIAVAVSVCVGASVGGTGGNVDVGNGVGVSDGSAVNCTAVDGRVAVDEGEQAVSMKMTIVAKILFMPIIFSPFPIP